LHTRLDYKCYYSMALGNCTALAKNFFFSFRKIQFLTIAFFGL